MPTELKEGYIKTSGAGSHAEVNALNEALLQRPDADLKDLMVYVVSARKINKRCQKVSQCLDVHIVNI